MNARLESIARHVWNARRTRQKYANLPDSLKPTSIDEAYETQEEYWRLAELVYGPVADVKVATTTKVMQQLMGITHPCGGAIFSKTILHLQDASRRKTFSLLGQWPPTN